MSIPFEIPAKFLSGIATGSIDLYEAILKDTATGQIVGHVQQTGALNGVGNSLLSSGFGIAHTAINPIGAATGIFGVVDSAIQNRQIQRKLDDMQSLLGVTQGIGIANLATSVIGIGVTVASTAIILSRLNTMERQLEAIASRLDRIENELKDRTTRERLVSMRTQLERFDELNTLKNSDRVLARVEEEIHEAHGQFCHSLKDHVERDNPDPELVSVLIKGVLVSGTTAIQALMIANELETALHRAERQSAKFKEIAWALPADIAMEKFDLNTEALEQFEDLLHAGLAQQTTQPSLLGELLKKGYKGGDYLQELKQETEEPILILASDQT